MPDLMKILLLLLLGLVVLVFFSERNPIKLSAEQQPVDIIIFIKSKRDYEIANNRMYRQYVRELSKTFSFHLWNFVGLDTNIIEISLNSMFLYIFF